LLTDNLKRKNMQVLNKVIVVTGGGSGLGREIVLLLLSKNAKVITLDVHDPALKETAELAESSKGSLHCFVVDITDRAAVEKFSNDAIALYGFVDGIINNAGVIQPFVKLNDLKFETIERIINVNLYGTLNVTKFMLPHLLTRPEAHIVNVSSMGGFLPVPGQTIYCATKAAVKLLTEGLYAELLETNVKVTIVFPGAMQTNIMANSGIENRQSNKGSAAMKVLLPSKAAEIIVEGMEKNKPRIFVGKDSNIMDYLVRLNPLYAAKLIYKQMKTKLN
jgi:short-subunit dehydrogenase